MARYSILDAIGEATHKEAVRLWPWEDTEDIGLGLAEEVGEVCRAIVKRNHAISSGKPYKGRTVDEWTDNLRVELAQLVSIAIRLAYIEDFDLMADLVEVNIALQDRKSGE